MGEIKVSIWARFNRARVAHLANECAARLKRAKKNDRPAIVSRYMRRMRECVRVHVDG